MTKGRGGVQTQKSITSMTSLMPVSIFPNFAILNRKIKKCTFLGKFAVKLDVFATNISKTAAF